MMLLLRMSFYHILPSNTSPDTFPQNHASSYSTPVNNPNTLEGDWEVALLSVSHSNCINTFNRDLLTITHNNGKLSDIRRPTKFVISQPTQSFDTEAAYINNLFSRINRLVGDIVTFTADKTSSSYTYSFKSNKFHLFLSPCLKKALNVTNVLTWFDTFMKAYTYNIKRDTFHEEDCYMILIPTTSTHDTIELKKANEMLTAQELIKRYRERITLGKYPHLTLQFNKSKTHLMLQQSDDQHMAVVYSKKFNSTFGLRQNGNASGQFSYDFQNIFTDEWTMQVYPLDSVDDYSSKSIKHDIILEPKLFHSTTQLCQFMTKRIGYKDIVIEAKNNVAHLIIDSKDLRVEFSKDVQDILAFDESVYYGKCHVKGSDVISLSRRINYFYIYSNISEYIRVGDTEAPLLCHFPFNPKPCSIITERIFKQPSYLKVKGNHLTQIDIGIYDDAGKLIPFHRDARTSIRLHFRRI